MPSLNALVSQPQSPDPPQQQGASGTGQDAGLPLQKPGDGATQGTMQPPSHHETVAVLQHISAFDQRWRQILNDPGIGKDNVRGQVMDAMADLMGENYCTLPQTMSLLKTLPTDPLEQKQWLEEHVGNDQKAMNAVRQHYLQSRPPMGSFEDEMAAVGKAPADRSELVKGAMVRYKAYPKRPTNMKGIPIRNA